MNEDEPVAEEALSPTQEGEGRLERDLQETRDELGVSSSERETDVFFEL